MRAPSRTMLPINAPSKRALLALWAGLGAALAGFLWFASLWSVVVLVGIALAVWLSGTISLRKQRARLLSIASGRPGESICHFARSFDTRTVNTWVIRAVYELLQRELKFAHPAFPVRASDSLEELLFDPDDLDMAVAPEVARRARRSLDHTESNPYYGNVRSVADLVMFFNAQPATNET
jgi:hypothetical protein